MTPVDLDRQEREAFLSWRRGLADLAEKEELLLTPFERNIGVWRQLWRVLERSQLVVQIVDARNPLRFRCEDLEAYVGDIEGPEGEKGSSGVKGDEGKKGKRKSLLLVNKADLLTRCQRIKWADYFDANGVEFAFYSALDASALLEQERAETITALPEKPEIGHDVEKEEEIEDGSESSGPTESEDEQSSMESGGAEESSDPDDGPEEVETDPRVKVLTVKELEELFIRSAPPLSGAYQCSLFVLI
jgi:large subunit GTPase 1